jgi:hypothetical protein
MMPSVALAQALAVQRKREAAFCNFWHLVEHPGDVRVSIETVSAKFSVIDKGRLP